MTTVVLGSQFGDEGKGKLVDILCGEAQLCARSAGGNNAGHTIVTNGVTYDFHILPSGLVNPNCINLIGSGCVVHVPSFFKELGDLKTKGLDTEARIFISDRAHITFDLHTVIDGLEEQELGKAAVGTTKKGIGPTYSSKAARSNARISDIFSKPRLDSRLRALAGSAEKRYGELFRQQHYNVEAEIARFDEYRETLQPFVIDAVPLISSLAPDARVLVEGANALMLDIDYGTYPFVTSSNAGLGGVFTGLGISPFRIKHVIGAVKAYTTRVGSGPLPTEQLNADGDKLQTIGREYGVTTGRRRRCGWLDLVIVKYSTALNHYTALNLTKLDVLDTFPEIKVAVAYRDPGPPATPTSITSTNGTSAVPNGTSDEKVGSLLASFPADLDVLERVNVEYVTLPGWMSSTTGVKTWDDLPENARGYIKFIEEFLQGPKCVYVGTGPDRGDMIVRS